MSTIIWQSDDSFDDMFIVYSGTAALNPRWSGGGERLFSDDNYLYKLGLTILRINHGGRAVPASGTAVLSGTYNFEELDITPASGYARWLATHFLDDFAQAIGTFAVGTSLFHSFGPTLVYSSFYPEIPGAWITQSGYPSKGVQDVEGPDYVQSPRVLVAFQRDPEEKVGLHTVTGFSTIAEYYATNWSVSFAR